MEELGDTIEKVAYEKAGIIKSNCEVVLYQQDDSVHKIIEKRCKKNVASLHKVDFKHLEVIKNNLTGQTINFEDFKRISFGLLGKFQTKNAAVVLKTIEIMKRLGWDINQAAVEKGMNKTQWPGRFEILDEDKPVIVDGAHNPNGVSELINNIQYYFNNKKVIFIVGFLKDKDYNTMLARVLPFAKHFVLIQPESNRALPTNELAKVLRRKGYENTSEEVDASAAIKKAYSLAEKDTVIIAFGSLYMIGDIKNYFMLTKKE